MALRIEVVAQCSESPKLICTRGELLPLLVRVRIFVLNERIILRSWYKRSASEFCICAAIFFPAATVSGAFGSLLAVSARRDNSVSLLICDAGRHL